jgi:hypothetical protein
MSLFALVRHVDDLDHACRQISDLLAYRKQRAPERASDRCSPEPLGGVWVEPRLVHTLPARLLVHPSNAPPARLREAVGVPGLWHVCRLDGEGVSRLALLDALVEASHTAGAPALAGCFAPVFSSDTPDAEVQGEVHTLIAHYPHRVGAPLRQHPYTGHLTAPPTFAPAAAWRT